MTISAQVLVRQDTRSVHAHHLSGSSGLESARSGCDVRTLRGDSGSVAWWADMRSGPRSSGAAENNHHNHLGRHSLEGKEPFESWPRSIHIPPKTITLDVPPRTRVTSMGASVRPTT